MARFKNRLTVPEVRQALMENRGVLAQAAEALGCHRHTVENYIARHSELQIARVQAMEIILDKAETNFYQAVQQGDLYASKFVLERKGRSRGWAPTPITVNTAQVIPPFTMIVRVPAGKIQDYIDAEAVEIEAKQIGSSSGSE